MATMLKIWSFIEKSRFDSNCADNGI